jgi:hypothetical protein
MSVNYTSLKNLVADFLARDDISTTALNTFIDVIESDITASFSPKELDDYVELPVQPGNFIILPDDYRLSRVVKVGDSTPIQQIDPQSFFENTYNNFLTTIGNKMYFGKSIQGDTCTMLYSKRIPSLVKEEENAISLLYPSLYIYGCLKEAAAYIDDKQKLAMYEQKYAEALETAAVDADTSRYSGSRLVSVSTTTLLGGQ